MTILAPFRRPHLRFAALALIAALFGSGCGSSATPASSPTAPSTPASLPLGAPASTSVTATSTVASTPSSVPPPPSSDASLLAPPADQFFGVVPGAGIIELNGESADTPAGPIVHVLSADIGDDELRVLHGPFIPADDPDSEPLQCTGASRAEGTTWSCGVSKPSFGERFSYSVEDGFYVLTIEGVPADAVAVDLVATNGFRIRTEPIDGYAVIAGSRVDGNPRELIAYRANGESIITPILISG